MIPPMMLSQLLMELLHVRETSGNLDAVAVGHVRADSRRVAPGDLYVATKTVYTDGHKFIADAIARGAAAVVFSDPPAELPAVPWVRVHSGTMAVGPLASARYGHPSHGLGLLGVTGTNGKTTVTWMLESILTSDGRKAGRIGTTGAHLGSQTVDTGFTTPEAPELQELLHGFLAEGGQAVAMEVSSHAIALRRVHGCRFSVGVFLGIGSDHLDFHGTLEEYSETKVNWLLGDVQHAPSSRGLVVPADDPWGQEVMQEHRGRLLSFGFDDDADIYPAALELGPELTRGRIATPEGTLQLWLRMPGRHNVRNALAAIAAAQLFGVEPIAIVEGLERFQGVPGRVEPVKNDRGLTVLVDYAHTPDALKATITSLRELTEGRVLVVFGCGGDRDRTKRPEMGRVVHDLADVMVVTSDNPRSEPPHQIIDEILLGLPVDADPERLVVEVDRRVAIETAISLAEPGDVVLIAGKGHETYQILAEGTVPFDDRTVAAEVLAG